MDAGGRATHGAVAGMQGAEKISPRAYALYVSKKFFPRPPRMAEVRKMQEQFSTNAAVGMKSGFLEVPLRLIGNNARLGQHRYLINACVPV